VKFFEGQTICVEVMDAMGNPKLVLGKDGWTYQTKDGSLTGMFEDTIVITSGKPEILTR
jgi:methionine aminopeptidase